MTKTRRRMQALYSANSETASLYALINGHGDDLNSIIKTAEFARAMRLGITTLMAVGFVVVGFVGSIAMNNVTFTEATSYIVFGLAVLIAGWIKMRPKVAFIDGYATFVEEFRRIFHIEKFPPCFQYSSDEVRRFIHRELLEKMRWALFGPTQAARDSSRNRFDEIHELCEPLGFTTEAEDYEVSFNGYTLHSVVDTDVAMRQLQVIIEQKRSAGLGASAQRAG